MRIALTTLLLCLLAAPAPADELPGGSSRLPGDPVSLALRSLPQRPYDDPAPLWSHEDATLQRDLERALRGLGLQGMVESGRLGVALVDVTDVARPRVAAVNGDRMVYAASLPKIAILLGVFEEVDQGRLAMDGGLQRKCEDMIRASSNTAATDLLNRVGKEKLNRLLIERYRLYDPRHGGGLWVGKDYAKRGLWRRDPLHNLSHGATAMQVARFYYLLETGRLVSPASSRKMKQILGGTLIDHKFAKALHTRHPKAELFRKSGTWGRYHSDSALVEHGGRSYILVALSDGPPGGSGALGEILLAVDRLITAPSS